MKTVYDIVQSDIVQLPLFALTKVCKVCHEEKPLCDDYFVRDASKKDGYRNFCKVCISERRRQQYAANPEKYRALTRAAYAKNPHYALASQLRRRPIKNAKEREKVANDPEYRARKYNKQRESVRKRPDLRLARYTRYRKAHMAQFAGYTMKRYARKKAATVEDVDYQQILEQSDGICYICEKAILPHHKIEFDHMVPIARGGIHAASNIKVTHNVCNSRKHDKLIEEMTPFQRRGPDN